MATEVDVNTILANAVAIIAGGVGTHWIKMRKDIKSAHAKLRDICERVKDLERKDSKDG